MAKTSLPSYIKDSIKDHNKRKLYREWLRHQLGVNRYLVWDDLEKLGLKSGFKKLIQFKVGKRNLRAWTSLFEINEMVYQELVAEFMTTYKFDKSITRLDSDAMIQFNFQGKEYKLSLATFARHLDLYTEYQVTTSFFLKADTDIRQRDHAAIWSELASERFRSNVKASVFHDRHHRVLHNLLACSIRGKKLTKGAVGKKDLLMIKSIIEQEHVNVAYLVADRILTESTYAEEECAYMGAVITKLVRKMGILTEEVIDRLTAVKERESQPYDINYMVKVWLLEKEPSGEIRWRGGELIPGVTMRPPKSRRIRVAFDDSTVHREPRNEVRHDREEGETSARDVEAQSSLIPPPRVFNWGDPVSSELMYGMLQMIHQNYTQSTYLAQEFGFPKPAPPSWICGPLPPDFATIPLHTFAMTPLTTTIPSTTTTTTTTRPVTTTRAHRSTSSHPTEPVFAVHTTTTHMPQDLRSTVQHPSSRAMTRPRAAESATSETSSETDSPQSEHGQDIQDGQDIQSEHEQEIQTDYQPVMFTGPTLSGLTGLLNTNPVSSSDLPPVNMTYEHNLPLGSCDVADMSLDSNFQLLPTHQPHQTAPGQHRASSSGSVSRRASSGQHSATQQTARISALSPLHESPADQDYPLP